MLIRLILEQHVKKVEESNLGQIPTLSLSSESSTLESSENLPVDFLSFSINYVLNTQVLDYPFHNLPSFHFFSALIFKVQGV